jgi:Kdo2-lipid IVA lauroyltransferase/acyltransferase
MPRSFSWNHLKTQFRYRVEYASLWVIMRLLWILPLRAGLAVASGLGRFIFSVLRIRRRVTLENLASAFPGTPERELESIALHAYQNFTKMAVEYARFPVLSKEKVLSSCDLEGKENLDRALALGKGAVLVAGHFGNWELMGAYLAHAGYKVSFLVGQQKNGLVDDVMNRHREAMGIEIIHMGVAVRGVIRALHANGWVAMLADQDAGRDGVFVDFLGRKASNHQGPAVFALRTGAPIIFGTAIRLPGGRHRIVVELLTFEGLSGVTPENIAVVTQAYTSVLEKWVRLHPDHWFWMHRRWKTRPPDPAAPTTAAPSA